jgi:hypothetical protein
MRELIGKIPTKDPNVTEVVYLAEMVRCLDCEQTVPWVSRWSRSKKTENPRRLCGTCATAADMVLITKRRRKVCLFGPILDRKRCSVSAIQSGA